MKHRPIVCLRPRTLFPRFDIKGPGDDVYLRRWYLVRLFGWKLMLHKMERPDSDREPHDHPWWFWSVVLKGGYLEQIFVGNKYHSYRERRAGRLVSCRPKHTHRVAMLMDGKPCWTLLLRGPRVRSWGFYTDCGWMPWKKFIERKRSGVPICEDE